MHSYGIVLWCWGQGLEGLRRAVDSKEGGKGRLFRALVIWKACVQEEKEARPVGAEVSKDQGPGAVVIQMLASMLD